MPLLGIQVILGKRHCIPGISESEEQTKARWTELTWLVAAVELVSFRRGYLFEPKRLFETSAHLERCGR